MKKILNNKFFQIAICAFLFTSCGKESGTEKSVSDDTQVTEVTKIKVEKLNNIVSVYHYQDNDQFKTKYTLFVSTDGIVVIKQP